MKYAALFVSLFALTLAHKPFIVQLEWNYINYTWPTAESYQWAKDHNEYNETRANIRGMKLWKDTMYLAIPKWKPGIPVSLASTSKWPIDHNTAPLLAAFPNWSMHHSGNCSALQNVRNLEVDPKGRMWILDNGSSACPAKLVILDLENDDQVLLSYAFPESVADPQKSELTDIALDHEDGGYAYISDSKDPGIVVFSLKNRTSWRVVDDSMRADPEAVGFVVGETLVKEAYHVSGLTLSPASTEGNRTLYYAPLSSFKLFALSTRALRSPRANFSETRRFNASQISSMAMSSTGALYFNWLAGDRIYCWDSKVHPFATGHRVVTRDRHLLQWTDALAFDQDGKVWVVSNRMQLMLGDSFDVAVPNVRALAAKVSMFSYQYYENGTVPVLPVISLE